MKGTPAEPRRALIIYAILNVAFIIILYILPGNAINILAKLMTLFALYTFLVLNISAFVEGYTGNPSFRPTFKYFHWSLALAGAIVCFLSALFVDTMMTAICLALLFALYFYLNKRNVDVNFNDARSGLAFKLIRKNLKALYQENNNNLRNCAQTSSYSADQSKMMPHIFVSLAKWKVTVA